MITQKIKRWWHKLFAWWPWRRSPQTGYTRTTGGLNPGASQDAIWRTTVDGPLSQSGITSVAVEQERNEFFGSVIRSTADERAERFAQQNYPAGSEEFADADLLSATDGPGGPLKSIDGENITTPTFEQQLEFLHYLVEHGIINEGFSEGQVPQQYKRKG